MTTYDLQLTQKTDFLLSVTLTDDTNNAIDLSSYGVQSYIKSHYGDSGALVSLNPQIIVPSSGIITLSLTANDTTGIPVGINFYDVKLTTGNSAILALAGKVYVSPSI